MESSKSVKIEYVAIALNDREVRAYYGDYIIKAGTEKMLNELQAHAAKDAGAAYFPACASESYGGYFRVPCKVIKRTTTVITRIKEEEY